MGRSLCGQRRCKAGSRFLLPITARISPWRSKIRSGANSIRRMSHICLPGKWIGLAVVKLVAELHGGKVSVKSGDGVTVFTVKLPK